METHLLIEIILAVLFVISMIIFIYIKRKNMAFEKVLYPFFYLVLYRSGFGLKFMKNFARKYRAWVQLFGYACIGMGIFGLIYISIMMIIIIGRSIMTPSVDPGFALVLPFTNIPGVGYLSFLHWIVAIFLLAIVHEFSHGIVAEAHDVKVKSSGFVFFALIAPLIPGAFVEPDEKQLSKKSDVVQYSVFAAGPVINILIALIILISMPFVLNPSELAPFEETITEPIGLSFTPMEGTYPSTEAGMEAGILQEVDGVKITDFQSFVDATYGIRPNESLNIVTDKGTYDIMTTVAPDNPKKGFIGIQWVANERRVRAEYEWIKAPYYWIKELIKWFFLFNFAIGLFNLLPLGIVDGGRMTGIFLEKLYKDKKKAKAVWGKISLFFLILVLAGLALTYIVQPLLK